LSLWRMTPPARLPSIGRSTIPNLNEGVAQKFHELFPASDLFLLSSARHFVQMDEPEEVARLILSTPTTESKG